MQLQFTIDVNKLGKEKNEENGKVKKVQSRFSRQKVEEVTKEKIEKLILKHEQVKNKAKELYGKADEIQDKLIKVMGVEQKITLTDGRIAVIHNNFTDKDGNPKNVAWKPCGVKLYELKVK